MIRHAGWLYFWRGLYSNAFLQLWATLTWILIHLDHLNLLLGAGGDIGLSHSDLPNTSKQKSRPGKLKISPSFVLQSFLFRPLLQVLEKPSRLSTRLLATFVRSVTPGARIGRI
jgi:hypothetical protein